MNNFSIEEISKELIKEPTSTFSVFNLNVSLNQDVFNQFISKIKKLLGENSMQELDGKYIFKTAYNKKFVINLQSTSDNFKIKVICAKTDHSTMYTLRAIANEHKLKVKHDDSGIRLPENPNLIMAEFLTLSQELQAAFDKTEYELVFMLQHAFQEPDVFYLKAKDGCGIYLVNNDMLDFFLLNNTYEMNNEFVYKVADNIEDFATKFDLYLIPTEFHEYYGKNLKIINDSKFSIDKINRKVFILPYVYEIGNSEKNINQLSNSAMLADKVRPGETLDMSIKRILREELKITDDYIGALVESKIEYDYDRENKITPKLTIRVYIEKTDLNVQSRKSLKKSWRSLDKDVS